MQFLKKFFSHDNIIVGLSGLKRQENYVKINIPENYKKFTIQNSKMNYILL